MNRNEAITALVNYALEKELIEQEETVQATVVHRMAWQRRKRRLTVGVGQHRSGGGRGCSGRGWKWFSA